MNREEMSQRERLQNVLERHGADPSRWPLPERGLVELVAQDPQAEKLFRQAQALDQLLYQSGQSEIGPAGGNNRDLEQAILADFEEIIGAQSSETFLLPMSKKISAHPAFLNNGAWAAGALAACFALGIYLGSVGIGGWRLDPATSFASLSATTEQRANLDGFELPGLFEEDYL